MKKELTTKIYEDVFGIKENHFNVNKEVRAVIVNFGTRRKYADFTNGKKKAELHPLEIVFTGVETAKMFHQRYIGKDGEVHTF